MTIDDLKKVLTERKTAFVELDGCEKCGCPIFYFRKGRKHNGCVACHMAKKDLANTNSLPTEASQIDENGVRVYEGRSCKTCGNKIRLGERAYGAKNIGACRECSIHAQAEKEQGKQLKRLTTSVNEHAHKFVVDSIQRSGCVEVAPHTLMEWLELKDLIQRCRLMNEQEKAVQSGIHWEVCHVYPADPDGSVFKGKATVENLVIATFEQNRRDGNRIPDEWTLKQVVSIADVRLIQRSFEAAKAWKERRTAWATMTDSEKAEWQAREQAADSEHKKLVREITRGYCESLPLVEEMQPMPLSVSLEKAELQWLKIQHRMSNIIDAAAQRQQPVSYVKAKGERIMLDAFHGAEARAWITYQTLQQVADAEMILREQGMTEEQEQQLSTVKRCAVLWAIDVNQNPRQLVMGFTHPLMNVLGDVYTWGTKTDEQGEQWICVWEPVSLQAIADQSTPFDGTAPDPEFINAALMEVPEPVKQFSRSHGWRNTDEDYIYEQEKRKRAKAAAEQRQREQEAAAAARREANKEKVSIRVGTLRKWLSVDVVKDLNGLYDYAGEMLPEALQADAHTLINEQFEKVADYEQELQQFAAVEYDTVEKAETELNNWEASNQYRINQMCRGAHVFADLLNPF